MSKVKIMEQLSKIFNGKDGQYTYAINAQSKALDFSTVDVIIESVYEHGRNVVTTCPNSALDFVHEHLLAKKTEVLRFQAFKLLMPSQDGYVSRSDMVGFRMHGINIQCQSFVEPRQYIRAFRLVHDGLSLYDCLEKNVGLLFNEVYYTSTREAQAALDQLESDLYHRMSISWLLPEPIPYRRVALVGGLEEPRSFESVKAMGIGLVILDTPGNFLEDPNGQFAHLREEFIPFNMNPDEHAAERIVEALKDKHIDGIHTRYDIHHTNVAKANRALGLPTSDPESYATATNKFDARALEPDKNSAFRVRNVDELKSLLPNLALQYPLIVKPTTGRNSWGVLRCDDQEQLIEATDLAHRRLIGITEEGKEIHSEVMIEPYVDGPEFDVDIVLWDGETLFYEVSDNFPCAGDIPADAPENFSHQKQTHRDFQETLFVYPSTLVYEEQQLLVDSLCESIRRLGFCHGVFHVEARVRNSTMKYSIQHGRVDLYPDDSLSSKGPPSCFLIETNPRPPGYLSLLRAGWMYGVDYWALHVLRCINDEARFRAFSMARRRDPKHVCALNFIMPENGGILKSGDPGPTIAERRPDIISSIPLYYNEFSPGQYVPPPVSTNFLFMTRMAVESHDGRGHLLDVIRDIRQEWTFDIEEQ